MAKRKSETAPGPKDFNPVMIPVSKLNKAEWNYKTDDEAMAAKLAANIKRNGILQASVVYESGGKVIVLDGNHRLDAYRKLGIKQAPCINMGAISEAAAKRIAIELNETHFDADPMRLAETIKELLAEFDDLEVTLPFTGDQIQGFGDLTGAIEDDGNENRVVVDGIETVEQLRPFNRTHLLISMTAEQAAEILTAIIKLAGDVGAEINNVSN